MKMIPKILALVLVCAMAFGLVPALTSPVQAASTPILVLTGTTAVNPILDHVLDFETFGSGGPFTIEWEWKCDLKANDPSDPNAFRAGVSVTGTVKDSITLMQWDAGFEGYNPPKITGKTDWTKGSFQFQDVGVYGVSGTNYPGNVLRFSLWKARGSVYIRNLNIKNAAGTVVYSMNTDPVMTQLVAQLESTGMTECDMGELAAIDFANCPWVAGQFSTGKYTSTIQLEGSPDPTTTSSITRPTKPTTTKPTTAKPDAGTTTKPTVTEPTTITTEPTTMGDLPCYGGNHDYVDGVCTYCGEFDPYYDPCANGHTWVNGACIYCSSIVPPTEPTTEPTAAPTTAPVVDSGTDDGAAKEEDGGFNLLWLIIGSVVLVAVVAGAIVVVSKKKK